MVKISIPFVFHWWSEKNIKNFKLKQKVLCWWADVDYLETWGFFFQNHMLTLYIRVGGVNCADNKITINKMSSRQSSTRPWVLISSVAPFCLWNVDSNEKGRTETCFDTEDFRKIHWKQVNSRAGLGAGCQCRLLKVEVPLTTGELVQLLNQKHQKQSCVWWLDIVNCINMDKKGEIKNEMKVHYNQRGGQYPELYANWFFCSNPDSFIKN